MTWRTLRTFSALDFVRQSRCASVSMYQMSMVYHFDQAASPLRNLLRGIVYLRFVPARPLRLKMQSVVWKIFRSIYVLFAVPPWMREIKSSR